MKQSYNHTIMQSINQSSMQSCNQSSMQSFNQSNNKMKKQIITLALIISLILPLNLFSQDVPPPPPPGHDNTGNQSGGQAPIGGGLLLLLGLGGAYGGFKGYRIYQKKKKRLLD